VLTETASRLRAVAGDDAVLARLGGDEFVAVLPSPDAELRAADLAFHLRRTLAQPIDVGMPVTVTTSIGIATAADTDRWLDDALAAADAAMYADKA
jgi:diguanylate cyclase (GGDEF)-like protein